MELIFEFLFEIIIEGSAEIIKNKKISKWIRYPIIFIVAIFSFFLLMIFTMLGISLTQNSDSKIVVAGLLIIIGEIILVFCFCKKLINRIKNDYVLKKD